MTLSNLPLDVWDMIFGFEPDDLAEELASKGQGAKAVRQKRKRALGDPQSLPAPRPWSGAALLGANRALRAVAQHFVARCVQGRRWMEGWYARSSAKLPWLLAEESDVDGVRREQLCAHLRAQRRWQRVPTVAGLRADPLEWACIVAARAPSQWLPASLHISDERCDAALVGALGGSERRPTPSCRDVVKSLLWYNEDTRLPVPIGRVRALAALCRGMTQDALRVAALAEEAPPGEDDQAVAARLLPLVRRAATTRFQVVESVLIAAARALDSVRVLQLLIGAHGRWPPDTAAKREPYEAQLRRTLWGEFLGKWARAYFPPRLVEWLVLFNHGGKAGPSVWHDSPRQRDRLCAFGTLATVAHAARHLISAVDARAVVAALNNPDLRVATHLFQQRHLLPQALLDAVLEHAQLLDAASWKTPTLPGDGDAAPRGRGIMGSHALAAIEALCPLPRPVLRYAFCLPHEDAEHDEPVDVDAVAASLARMPFLATRRLLRQRAGTQTGAQVALALAVRLRGGAPDAVEVPTKTDYLLALRQPCITEVLTML